MREREELGDELESRLLHADPHRNGQVVLAGAPLSRATRAMVLLHGRGASAQDILSLGHLLLQPPMANSPLAFNQTESADTALVAPQAAGRAWYPQSFLAPISSNEPWLSSALAKIANILESLEASGLKSHQVILCGFSQGACLAMEFAARHPARYASVLAFTGGLIGSTEPDRSPQAALPLPLDGVPVFLSSGDPDPHVPWARVQYTAMQMKQMGAAVTLHRYPGKSHSVSPEEVLAAQQLLAL